MTTLLLHGFTGSSAAWGPDVVDGLASAGRAPLLVDLPGHGRHAGEIDPERFTLDAAFAHLHALGRRDEAGPAGAGLKGADSHPDPVDLVGYSMGGRLALAYAARHPERVRRLVLESASPGLATAEERAQRRAADEDLAMSLEAEGLGPFVDRWEALPLFESQEQLPAEVRAGVRARRLLNDPASLAASLRGLGTGSLPSFWDQLDAVTMPVLLVVGELDTKFADIARRMLPRLPSGRLHVVPGAGHAVHLERPSAWVSAVASFLAEPSDLPR